MATTQLQDVFSGPQVLTTQRDVLFDRCPFFRAGVVRPMDPREGRPDPLNFVMRGCATTLPYWDFICAAACVSRPVSDDESDACQPDKIRTVADVILKHTRAKAWEASDLIPDCVGSDPLQEWAQAAALYQEAQYKHILATQFKGYAVGQANVPADMQDLVLTIGPNDDVQEALSLILADMIASGGVTCSPCMLVLDKRTLTTLKQIDQITAMMNPQTQCLELYWCGLPVVVMDEMHDPACGGSFAMILCRDAVIWSQDPFTERINFESNPCAGNGAGTSRLILKDRFIFHLRGISWQGPCDCQSPTDDELKDPANWAKAYDSKRIPWRGLFIDCPVDPVTP